jgi:hypothetical protein
MKFNKWTLGLAAVGAVSLASAAKADEKMAAIQTALSSTTISGYVDTSIQWNPGTGNGSSAPVAFQGPQKTDGFNLNVVQLSIAKPLDESEWASGYRVDLWFGPDASSLNTSSINSDTGDDGDDFAIRQAYVALRTPLGNGIDWKVGVFDTIIGYESLESGNNPNMTRSYGFTMEPTTHTGVLGSYRLNDYVSFSAGIANTFGPTINERAHGPNEAGGGSPTTSESYKTYMASVALTAPDDWGWIGGSTLYSGIINGFSSTMIDNQTHFYLGGTMATPVAGLKVGASFDYLEAHNFDNSADNVWTVAGYGSYQATEKLSFHGRMEYLKGAVPSAVGDDVELFALTGTVQYDLWENVISRLEIRWDRCMDSPVGTDIFGGRIASGSGAYETQDDVLAAGNGYNELDPPGFEDYHLGSTAVEDVYFGQSLSGTAPGNHSRNDAFLVALQFIYKF